MSDLTTIEFLAYLHTLDIKVSGEHNKLQVSAPEGIMTPDLYKELSARKADLIAFFGEAARATRPLPMPIERIGREGDLPTSFAQSRIWLLDQLEPDNPAYNIPALFRLKGNFDQVIFEKSLTEIIRRHEILRTYYVNVNGNIVQKIAPPEPLKMSVVDLASLPEGARQKEAERLASVPAYAANPFHLGKAPLIRAILLKMAPDEHVLLLDIHHIAVDGWSFGILVQELSVLYKAFLEGAASPLPELPIQYADFAAWQREWLQGEVLDRQLDYWKQKLGGNLPVLELPTDRTRPARQTYNGGKLSFSLSRQLTSELKALCQKEDVTLFVALLTAFNILLLRYTGQEDILVGTPIANRNHTEIEGLIGFFVNTLVMRTDLSGDPSFRVLLHQVQETALGAYGHQDLPFEKLVEELHPERDFSRTPVFQVMFASQNTPQHPFELPGLAPSRVEFRVGGAQFDLNVFLEENDEGLTAWWSYNTDLFDEATIARMAKHYGALLQRIVANPDQSIRALPILTDADRQELLVEWNTAAEPPSSRDLPLDGRATLHELFEAQAARRPEAVALTFEGQPLTYGEINARANRLARQLVVLGVKPDTLVGLCMERSSDLVVTILAILKSGGAYLPIDLSYPIERVAFILEDAQASMLLTHTKLRESLPSSAAKIFCVDELLAQPRDGEETNLSAGSDADNLAYVIYTSGTTGKPKGSLITHRNVVRLFASTEHWYGFNERDVWTLFHSCAFDFSVWEIWGALLYGGRLVIVPFMISRSPEAFYELLFMERVTVLNQTPSAFRQLVQAEGSVGQKPLYLRYVIFGGEALEMESLRPWFERHGDQEPRLVNMYGITETTVHVTYRPLSKSDLRSTSVIGVPIPDLRIYILDSQRQPVPIGVPGEMYVGGAGLARGYLRRPELTAERFIPDHLTGQPKSRLYKTGDLARFLPNRDIEYLGRIDDQVKIRGFRIELGEIETALGQHAAVREAAVIAREDVPGDKRLVAYVVPLQSAPDANSLREHLKKTLPEYMVPSAFVLMEKLPLTSNGKIDRRALPSPDQGQVAVKGEFVAPRDSLEQALTQIWVKVLRVKRVGLHDNFFELGGNSLLAVRIITEVEKLYQHRLPLATLLQAQTIGDLADVLRKDNWTPSWCSLVPLRPGGSKSPFFLMHAHGGNVLEYYALASHMDPDQPVYALQARGLDGDIPRGQSLADMAAAYLNEIRSLQPQGPYLLAGFCFGGFLALEAAHQLTAAGQEVTLLVMIQTMNPQCVRFKPGTTRFERWWYRAIKRMDLERENFSNRGTTYIPERIRRAWDIARARTEIAFDKNDSPRKNPSMPHILEVLAIENDRALKSYAPKPYYGDVLLFRASKQLRGLTVDEYLGWKDVFRGKLELSELPGHQQNLLLEPNVQLLAQELNSHLNAVQHKELAPTAQKR